MIYGKVTKKLGLLFIVFSCQFRTGFNLLNGSTNVKILTNSTSYHPWLVVMAMSFDNKNNTKTKLAYETSKNIPWQAQVISRGQKNLHCGGVIFSERVIITSAHCVTYKALPLDTKDVEVLLGTIHKLDGGDKYMVCRIKPHPDFQKTQYYYFDIALLLLKNQIKFYDKVKVARLVQNDFWRNPKYTMNVIGFGDISENSAEDYKNSRSAKLLKAKMRYVDQRECNNAPVMMRKRMPVPPHMFCLRSAYHPSECHVDAGSAAVWSDNVVGLATIDRVDKCGSTNAPIMYTDLHFFRNWIRRSADQLQIKSKCTDERKRRGKKLPK